MHKLIIMTLVFVLVCSLLCVGVLADEVISPEKDNTDVEVQPSSPQTGVETNLALVAVLAVCCGGVAVFSAKKALSR